MKKLMKKLMLWMLTAALVIGACGALAEEKQMWEKLERYYGQEIYGVAWAATFDDYVQSFYPIEIEQPERLISMSCPILPGLWMRISDGAADADEYRFKALRFVLDEGLFSTVIQPTDGAETGSLIADWPVSLEIVGEYAYGFIDTLSENTMMLTLIEEGALGNSGDVIQLNIDADTVGYFWDDAHPLVSVDELGDYFTPGQSCLALYNAETLVVMAMWHANG